MSDTKFGQCVLTNNFDPAILNGWAVRQMRNLIAGSRNYGCWYQYFNGIDATLNLRAGGCTVIGGTSTGQTVADGVPWPRPNTILTPRFFRIRSRLISDMAGAC